MEPETPRMHPLTHSVSGVYLYIASSAVCKRFSCKYPVNAYSEEIPGMTLAGPEVLNIRAERTRGQAV